MRLPDEGEHMEVSLTRFDVFCLGLAVGMMFVVGVMYFIPII